MIKQKPHTEPSFKWMRNIRSSFMVEVIVDGIAEAADGLRDEAALESALVRGENTAAYGDPDVFASAAGICAGIIRNMPFSSCNKQVALVCADAFLQLNEWQLCAKPEEAAAFVLAVAAGEIDEVGAAMFLRDYCAAVEGNT